MVFEPFAVSVYENTVPTFPFAVRGVLNTGTVHTGGSGNTVTVAVAVAVFDPLTQLIVYAVVVAGLTTILPEVEVAVVNAAEHETALLEFHMSVEVAPVKMVAGFAVRDTETSGVPLPHEADACAVAVFESVHRKIGGVKQT